MRLPVTTCAAGALGLLGAALAARVVAARFTTKVSLGDGGGGSAAFGEEGRLPPLALMQRAHGNFAEYAALGLVLLGLVELSGAPPWVSVALALMLTVGRAAHPFGVQRPAPNPFRAGGVILTLTFMTLASVWLLYSALTD